MAGLAHGAGRRLVLGTCVAALLFAAAPARADDPASARTLSAAYTTYLKSVIKGLPAARSADEAYIASIAARCPNVLASLKSLPAGSFNRNAVAAVGAELAADLDLASNPPFTGTLSSLTAKVKRLHWSSPARGRQIARALAAEHTYLVMPQSDLCADAQALAANKATATPPATAAFVRRYARVLSSSGLVPITLTVKRLGQPSERRAVNKLLARLNRIGGGLLTAEVPKLVAALGAGP